MDNESSSPRLKDLMEKKKVWKFSKSFGCTFIVVCRWKIVIIIIIISWIHTHTTNKYSHFQSVTHFVSFLIHGTMKQNQTNTHCLFTCDEKKYAIIHEKHTRIHQIPMRLKQISIFSSFFAKLSIFFFALVTICLSFTACYDVFILFFPF